MDQHKWHLIVALKQCEDKNEIIVVISDRSVILISKFCIADDLTSTCSTEPLYHTHKT